MAKKIKFGLKMADDADVRSIEDLREHFDLVKAIEYFTSGKLLEWLEDRFYDEAEKIGQLDKDAPDFQRQLCEILGVEPPEDVNEERDIDAIARAKEKEAILKQKTSDEQMIANAAKTAFDRDDLVELWGAGEDTIYLCGDEFNIPLRVENVKYIGILGTPKITISAKSREELVEKGISLENVELPEALREKKAEETKTCEYCGLANPASAKFCNGCGAAMDKAVAKEGNRDESAASVIAPTPTTPPSSTRLALKALFISNFKAILSWKNIQPDATWIITRKFGQYVAKKSSDIDDGEKALILASFCQGQYTEEDIVWASIDQSFAYGWVLTVNGLCCIQRSGRKEIIPYKSIQSIDLIDYMDICQFCGGQLFEDRINKRHRDCKGCNNSRPYKDCKTYLISADNHSSFTFFDMGLCYYTTDDNAATPLKQYLMAAKNL